MVGSRAGGGSAEKSAIIRVHPGPGIVPSTFTRVSISETLRGYQRGQTAGERSTAPPGRTSKGDFALKINLAGGLSQREVDGVRHLCQMKHLATSCVTLKRWRPLSELPFSHS